MSRFAEKSHLVSKSNNSPSDNTLMQAIVGVIEDYKHQKSIRSIPLKLFSNRKLGVLEVIVKYLKENQNLPYNEIASLLNRDDRTIWTSYNKAIKKHKDKFSQNNTDTIDISIFHDRKQAPLQALVNHLKEKGMSYKKIAEALNRSYKTIWITNKRK